MTNPQTVKNEELTEIRKRFKANKNADVVETVTLVRFTDNHVLVEMSKTTALLFKINK